MNVNIVNNYRNIIESISNPVVITDLDNNVIDCNNLFARYIHKKKINVVGNIFGNIFPYKLNHNKYTIKINDYKENDEKVYKFQDKYYRISIDLLKNDKRENTGYILIIYDITKQKLIEEGLIESKENLRALFSAMTELILEIDLDGKYIAIAPTSPDLLIQASSEILGRYLHEFFSKEKTALFLENIADSIKHKRTNIIEYMLELREKETWFEAHIVPKSSNTVLFIARDISQKRDNELALKKSERKYRLISENSHDIIILLINNKIKYVSPALEKLSGIKPEDFIANYPRYIHPEDLKMQLKIAIEHKHHKIKKSRHNQRYKYSDGTYHWFENNITFENSENGDLITTVVARNIDNRMDSEKKLQESWNRYKYLFNQSPASIWEEDFSEVFDYLRLKKEQGITNLKEYFLSNLGEVKKCSQMVKIIDINEMTVNLFNAKDKNDLITNLDTIFTEESLVPFIDQLCSIFDGKMNFEGETINRTLDGKLLNVKIRLNVVPSHEKNYSKVVISLIDITKQKIAEAESRKGRERLKLLNQIIRHDLANDFVVIESALRIFDKTKDNKMIDEIRNRAEKSLCTIDKYRKYEDFIESNSDLYEVNIKDCLEELAIDYPNIKFKIAGNCSVFADEALKSVFINLINNSIIHGKANEIAVVLSLEKEICTVTFSDNGLGIKDKIKKRIFDKGFHSGETGNTGIGLYIVKQTIKRYGGSISVSNNYPTGTIFDINLRKPL